MRIVVALARMAAEPWQQAIDEALRALGVAAEIEPWSGRATAARYALVWQPPAELFQHERDLRVVFNLGAGVEALLAQTALPPQLPVVRLVDAGMATVMAEYVCFAIARITRGLHRFGGPHAERDWFVDRPRGRRPAVGVLGLGAIGAQIAASIAGFGYPVLGWSRTAKSLASVQSFAGERALPEFLRASEILVDVLPLTAATRGLLNCERLALLPAGGHLINVGRGGTIVDDDLLALLDAGHIASATLDVFETEPLPAEHRYWHHARVTVTPHLAGPTPREPAAQQIAAAIAALERGVEVAQLAGYVDRQRGY